MRLSTPARSDVTRLERRQQTRHGLRLRSNFEWTDTEGVVHAAQGFTRDICSKGMFIYADFQPPPKADLHVEVLLSSDLEFKEDHQLRLRASALVLRVEPTLNSGVQGGFATLNKSYELLRGDAVIEG